MVHFDPAFNKLQRLEGGWVLTEISGDDGGLTFAGISRRAHPGWRGWAILQSLGAKPKWEMPPRNEWEEAHIKLMKATKRLYREDYWNAIGQSGISSQEVATACFTVLVNFGRPSAIETIQRACRTKADGMIGPITVAAINAMCPSRFVERLALESIRHYILVVENDRTKLKFLRGWCHRALEIGTL